MESEFVPVEIISGGYTKEDFDLGRIALADLKRKSLVGIERRGGIGEGGKPRKKNNPQKNQPLLSGSV